MPIDTSTQAAEGNSPAASPTVLAQGEEEVDYTQLQEYLEAEEWQEADRETVRLMVELGDSDRNTWLGPEEVLTFPCEELQQIDRLWVTYSDGRFGFSIQEKIYHNLGGEIKLNYDEVDFEILEAFLERLGWFSQEESLLEYKYVTFDLTAPEGHLPLWLDSVTGYGVPGCESCLTVHTGTLFFHVKACGL